MADFVIIHDLDEIEAEDARAQAIADRWARLLRAHFGLRRLQQIFASVGQHLRVYPPTIRDRVSATYRP